MALCINNVDVVDDMITLCTYNGVFSRYYTFFISFSKIRICISMKFVRSSNSKGASTPFEKNL